MSAPRLAMETKNQIVAAYIAGEKIADIAERFGVHQSYPMFLTRRRGHLVTDRRTKEERARSREARP